MSLICKSSLQNVAQSRLLSPRCCSSNLKQSAVALVRLTAAGRGRMELGAVLQRDVQTHHRTHHTEPQQHIVHWPAHTHTDTHICMNPAFQKTEEATTASKRKLQRVTMYRVDTLCQLKLLYTGTTKEPDLYQVLK